MTGAVFVRRTLRSSWPLVDLRTFRDRNFTVGCVLSFVLGIGLFGSVYLMPVFLVYVRARIAVWLLYKYQAISMVYGRALGAIPIRVSSG